MTKKRPTPAPAGARRYAVQRNQITDLILHGSLTTTEARAKNLKSTAERFIARARDADLSTRRRVLAHLTDERAAKKLFDLVVPQFKNRTGGCVRVVKLAPRRGDRAPIARVEFVEEIVEAAEEGKVKRGKTRKSRKEKDVKGSTKGEKVGSA